jgi:gamma-glutamyl:cysteine ligase YbdK (ATP-grasp superfamily)
LKSEPASAPIFRRRAKILPNCAALFRGCRAKREWEIIAASTHPFSKWSEQDIFDDERYEFLVEELQMVARSLLIFGLHVHVGIVDLDRRIHIMNAARYFLPHVMALTNSSPFWLGHHTDLNLTARKFSKNFRARTFPTISILTRNTSVTSICSSV